MSPTSVDVVIPVYADLTRTKKCINSVLNDPDRCYDRLVVIDDASPDAELSELCESLASQGVIELIRHERNLGFVSAVNAGMKATEDHEIVILNSDTEVPPGWLTRLRAAADQNPSAASITPFSNNATIFSYPHLCQENALPEGLDCLTVDALFATSNSGGVIEVPTGVGFCMYLRRAAIDDVGPFDEAAFGRGYGEENDWCLRATARGWKHLLCADLFVYHAGGASFGSEAESCQANALAVISQRYPDYERDIAAFIEEDPMEPARFAVDIARPDAATVVSEYRQRERSVRGSRYELDRQRHEQVTALDNLLIETREAAASERQRYEELLESERQHITDKESQYQAQLEEMAAGYRLLESSCRAAQTDLRELNRFWPVRLRRWLQRRLGG